MKKMKKVISVVLAAAMVSSVAAVAFAANDDVDPAELSARITALPESNLSSSDGQKIAADYKALGDRRSEVYLNAAGRLSWLVWQQAKQEGVANNGNLFPTFEPEAYKAFSADLVGAYDADMEAGLELFATINGVKEVNGVKLGTGTKFVAGGTVTADAAKQNVAALQQVTKAYNDATDAAKRYSDIGKSATYDGTTYVYFNSTSFTNVTRLIALQYNYLTQTAAVPSATDADKAAAYQAAIKEVVLPESYQKAVETADEMAKAYQDYIDTTSTTKVEAAYDKYVAMTSEQQTILTNLTTYCKPYILPNASGKLTLTSVADMVKLVMNLCGTPIVEEFMNTVSTAAEPFSQEVIRDALDLYNQIPAIPDILFKKITADVKTKYTNMLWALKLVPTEGVAALNNFTAGSITMPEGISDARAERAVAAINDLAKGFITPDLVNGLFTNANVTTALAAIYPLLAGVNSMLSHDPSDVAQELSKEGCKEELNYAAAKEALPLYGWDELAADPSLIDWGFEDGDMAGFTHAVVAGLRPIFGLILGSNASYLYNGVDNNAGIVTKAYERAFIPLLEGLGITDVMPSQEYTDKVRASVAETGYADEALLLFLGQLKPLIEKVTANPVETLVELLPNLAYLLDDGSFYSALKGSLAVGSMLPDLSASALVGMINGALAGTGLVLPEIDWDTLISLGTAVKVDSASLTATQREVIQVNKGQTLVFVLRYLQEVLINNEEPIMTLLGGIEGIGDILPLLEGMLPDMKEDKDALAVMLIELLTEPDPVEPTTQPDVSDTTTDPTVSGDTTTAPSEGTNGTEDGGNVSTGDIALSSFAVISLAAGAAFVIARKKRVH